MNVNVHQPISPLHLYEKRKIQTANHQNDSTFKQLLKTELTKTANLKLSKHAETRLHERKIHLTNEMWNKVEKAVYQAEQKGVKEALVLTNQAAFVVSTTKKVVITALDRKSASEHVFTNIDGTIVIEK